MPISFSSRFLFLFVVDAALPFVSYPYQGVLQAWGTCSGNLTLNFLHPLLLPAPPPPLPLNFLCLDTTLDNFLPLFANLEAACPLIPFDLRNSTLSFLDWCFLFIGWVLKGAAYDTLPVRRLCLYRPGPPL